MKKPNWKQRALAAEKEVDKLANELAEKETELITRPTVEKIVEKEVLPRWVRVMMYICLGGWLYLSFWTTLEMKKLQHPVEKPHAVYLSKVPVILWGRNPYGGILTPKTNHLKHHAKKTDCAPGFEPVGGACAEVGGTVSTEPVQDEVGYPKP